MNDDPRALLNITEDPETVRGRRGACWMIAIGTLVGFTAAGIVGALMLPRVESDWFGMRYIVTAGAGVLFGALSCVIFTAVSVVRRERHSLWAVLCALPCLALLLALGGSLLAPKMQRMQAEHESARVATYREQLRRDPGIAVREKWYVFKPGEDSTRWHALYDSFTDPATHYTVAQLQQIYDVSVPLRQYLFRHPACTPEFLAKYFPDVLRNDQNFNSIELESIITNPNCPTELVAKVAASDLVGGVVDTAKRELNKRAATPVARSGR